MGMFVVEVNGQSIVVDSPNKTAAGAYGTRIAEVKVRPANSADLRAADMAKVPVLVKGGLTEQEAAAKAAEKAAKGKPAEGGAAAEATAGDATAE